MSINSAKIPLPRIFLISFAVLIFLLPPIPGLAQSQPLFWTGSGGSGVNITVSEPDGINLSVTEQALLPLVQSTIIGSFQKFSAMNVFDRQNLEKIMKEQQISMDGNYSDEDFISIGKLTNCRLVVFGSITKIMTKYMIQFTVTDIETGKRNASYLPREVSLLALQNLSAIREVSAELLRQLGINLTQSALAELRSEEDSAKIQAENALAIGIASARQGTMADALAYYFEAAGAAPYIREEALNRISLASASVSGGNLNQKTPDRSLERDEWRIIVNAAGDFFSKHLPFKFIYNNDIREKADPEKKTSDLSVDLRLYPTDEWGTINNLRQGLSTARGSDNWNFSLDQIGPEKIIVSMQIVNENNAVVSAVSRAISNPGEADHVTATLTFRDVPDSAKTGRLAIRTESINGIPAQKAEEEGFMQIMSIAKYSGGQTMAAEAPVRREEGADFIVQRGIITGYTGKETVIAIPPVIKGERITGIGDYAFSNKSMTAVSIPCGVTSIGISAFSYNMLTEITIPCGVVSIGYFAFGVNRLTSVNIAPSVASIDHLAFIGNFISSITIGKRVSIKQDTFGNRFFTSYRPLKRAGIYTSKNNVWTRKRL